MPAQKRKFPVNLFNAQHPVTLDQDAPFLTLKALPEQQMVIHTFDSSGHPKLPALANYCHWVIAIKAEYFPWAEKQASICNHGYHPK